LDFRKTGKIIYDFNLINFNVPDRHINVEAMPDVLDGTAGKENDPHVF
jgi:hypothetical protein